MGCDIHGYIESKISPERHPNYWSKDADLHLSRNYAMFGLLAGVRSGENPIFPVRGWDENSSTKSDFCLFISDDDPDGEGNCSKERAEIWLQHGNRMIGENYITHPDWHTPSWLMADELEKVVNTYIEMYGSEYGSAGIYAGAVAMMKNIQNSRFIFWFDN